MEMTPHQSLELISRTISEAKIRFKENGAIFIFWGILIALASSAQFVLIQLRLYNINYYPYFIMPLGFVFTFLYYRNLYKKKETNNTRGVIGTTLKVMGITIGINLMIIGFFLFPYLDISFFPILILLLSLWLILAGAMLQFGLLLVSGIISNLCAFSLFFIDQPFHPLVLALIAIVALLIPGIALKRKVNV